MTPKRAKEWEDEMLALPLASKVSGEDAEHLPGDAEYDQREPEFLGCLCDRCKIIRIKKRRAFRFSRTKCPICGELFTSIYAACDHCRGIS